MHDPVFPEPRDASAERALLQGLSHELRAPLQSLLGHLDLLRNGTFGELTEVQADALDVVASNAEKILVVTRDVLQVARIDAGHEKAIAGEVDLAGLVRKEIASIQPLADAAGLTLAADCAPGLVVVSDGRKIGRILMNLLSNAVKYTQQGGVTVRAGRKDGVLFVEVSDTGIGIPRAEQEAVFLEYVRVNGEREGSGLGLPLARRLAALLGGRLTLESQPGRGTRVRLELPEG